MKKSLKRLVIDSATKYLYVALYDGFDCVSKYYQEGKNDHSVKIMPEIETMLQSNNLKVKERKGEYLGKTVQVIPHITNEIKEHIQILGKTLSNDMLIICIGCMVCKQHPCSNANNNAAILIVEMTQHENSCLIVPHRCGIASLTHLFCK